MGKITESIRSIYNWIRSSLGFNEKENPLPEVKLPPRSSHIWAPYIPTATPSFNQPIGHIFYMDFNFSHCIDGPFSEREIIFRILIKVDRSTGNGVPVRVCIAKDPTDTPTERGYATVMINVRHRCRKIKKHLFIDFPNDYNFIEGKKKIGNTDGLFTKIVGIQIIENEYALGSKCSRYTLTYGLDGPWYTPKFEKTGEEPYLKLEFRDYGKYYRGIK